MHGAVQKRPAEGCNITVMDASARFEFAGTGRFQVMSRLGAGGMGIVYEAYDRERRTRVALKTLRTLTADAVLRFKNEFRILQDIEHPNLVSLGELIEDGGQWFFTMELVDGTDFWSWVRPGDSRLRAGSSVSPSADTLDLRARMEAEACLEGVPAGALATGAPMPGPGYDEPRLRAAMLQLAHAVTALHDAGKVHRDIKPHNIRVRADGRVVLLDFGLVTESSADARVSDVEVVGTADYMAPEQGAAQPVGPAADWYAVGVLLYEALVGSLPFTGSALEVLMNKQRQTAPAPSQRVAGIPKDLDELCTQLLRFDPAARPTGHDVVRRLHGDELALPHTARSLSVAHTFVARERELEVLLEAFDEARVGQRPITMLVQGESGVGKSALVRRFGELLASRGQGEVVLAGRCYEREALPFKAFDGIVDALSRYLGRMPEAVAGAYLPLNAALLPMVFPVLRRVAAIAAAPRRSRETLDPQELRTRVFAGLRELLTRVAVRHPTVLVIEDLHWADADSLSLLAEVLVASEAPPLLLLATLRPPEERPDLQQALDTMKGLGADIRQLALGSLAPAEARELASRLALRMGATAVNPEAIASEAGGHPLYIDELVRHAASEPARPGPLRLEEALWLRVSRLDPAARGLLELLAVATAPLGREVAAGAAGCDQGELARKASLLRVAHLVRSTTVAARDALEPYHDRVRRAVLENLTVPERTRLHRSLAVAMESAGGDDPEALAVHWRGAGDDALAAHYAVQAGARAVEALAFARGARLFQLALDLQPDGPQRRELWEKLGDALADAGRGKEAATAYQRAMEGASAAHALELRRRAAEQMFRAGYLDEGIAVLSTVLDAVGMRLPTRTAGALAALLFRRAQARLRGLRFRERDASQISEETLRRIDICWSAAVGLTPDPIRAAHFQARHLLLALEAGEPYRVARALAMEVGYTATAGAKARRRVDYLIGEAHALAARVGHPHAMGLSTGMAGMAEYMRGGWKRGFSLLDEGEAMLRDRCVNVFWELDMVQLFAIECLAYMGEIAEVCWRVPLRLREAEERGDLFALSMLTSGIQNTCWLAPGGVDRARREADLALERWSRDGFHVPHLLNLYAQVQIDLYVGDGAGAMRRVVERWPALSSSLLTRVQFARVTAHHLRARAALAAMRSLPAGASERKALARLADKDAGAMAGEGVPYASAFATLIRAALAADRGDGAQALALCDAAASGFDAADMALYAAVARRRRGALVGGDEGAAARGAADAFMMAQKIVAPSRMADVLAPGF